MKIINRRVALGWSLTSIKHTPLPGMEKGGAMAMWTQADVHSRQRARCLAADQKRPL